MIEEVSTVILAGGQSRRFRGRDKARAALAGRSLIHHALDGWRGRVGELLISGRAGEDYSDLGVPVILDRFPTSEGPLAGIARAFEHTAYLMTVPCDAPGVDAGICLPLLETLHRSGAEVAIAHDGIRVQPLIALYRRDAGESLRRYLAGGRRSVQGWQAELHHVIVRLCNGAVPFANINTPEDLAAVEARNRIAPIAARMSTAP